MERFPTRSQAYDESESIGRNPTRHPTIGIEQP